MKAAERAGFPFGCFLYGMGKARLARCTPQEVSRQRRNFIAFGHYSQKYILLNISYKALTAISISLFDFFEACTPLFGILYEANQSLQNIFFDIELLNFL